MAILVSRIAFELNTLVELAEFTDLVAMNPPAHAMIGLFVLFASLPLPRPRHNSLSTHHPLYSMIAL